MIICYKVRKKKGLFFAIFYANAKHSKKKKNDNISDTLNAGSSKNRALQADGIVSLFPCFNKF